MHSLTLILLSYLVGSVPFGLIFGKLICGVDLREVGSGNIGASNAWRVLGWKVGLPALVLDLAKGLVPVLAAKHFGSLWYRDPASLLAYNSHPNYRAILVVGSGIAAILGHNFSPFLKFRGGKGVATSLGVCIAMSWKAAIAGVTVWSILLAITRYISVSSMIGTAVGSLAIWLDNGRALPYGFFGMVATVFVLVKHKPNIQRIRASTESKFGAKK